MKPVAQHVHWLGESPVKLLWREPCLLLGFWLFSPYNVMAQIDPVPRELVQLGYNAALKGHSPLSAYAFYYHNQPTFLRFTNITLRLAVAPTYLDSELGVREALGPYTDVGIGVAGGGFADSYAEIRRGKYITEESFIGHGGELSASIYHLFTPRSRVPLNGILRVSGRFSTYAEDDTDANFELPDDRGTFAVRTGLRWGGSEPTLYPQVAMGLSVWYEGQFRTDDGVYGYGDRSVEPDSHLFWAEALLAYTTTLRHNFDIRLTLGTSINPDRFSTYRLGALLPLISEFPLSLPGYYYQEISATDFVLLSGSYLLPLHQKQRWNLHFSAATALVDYLNGLDQAEHSHTGVGAGVLYRTPSFKMMVGYAYGVDALRSGERGAHSIGVLMQLNWGRARQEMISPTTPNLWRGVQRVFGALGD
jgi:hypothetical protein